MQSIPARIKVAVTAICVMVVVAASLWSRSGAEDQHTHKPAAAPAAEAPSKMTIGRFVPLKVSTLEDRASTESYNIPYSPRNYERVMMIDTATGEAWELDSHYGWVSLGVAPNSKLHHTYQK